MKSRRIAIIGAGPIGLEAALYASELGFDVQVYEQGEIGANILRWQHVRFFSQFEMNHSNLGAEKLSTLPEARAFLTGAEYVQQYLLPLSRLPELRSRIHTGTRILFISREDALKGDLIGDSKRKEHQFRLLVGRADGQQSIAHADIVLDASGVFHNPNWLGNGGIPAPGELDCRDYIDYNIPDVTGKQRSEFARKRSLLIGAGYSAATTACAFRELIRDEPETTLLWVTREERTSPLPIIKEDPLKYRAQLTTQANNLASGQIKGISCQSNTSIEAIAFDQKASRFHVTLRRDGKSSGQEFDKVIANVGYGPDNTIYRELQIHECYASRGPMNLAAALLGESSADCLDQKSLGADTLRNPEPDFYIIGNKSYGRNSTFLLKTGFGQIIEVFTLISGDETLNLYESATADKN